MTPGDGHITYIVNPKSGASSGRFACRQFHRYLTQRGYTVRVHLTASLKHARDLATAAAADPLCRLVVAAGGDGTIREAAHGLEGGDTPLLIAPAGTENLLANELGFDRGVETLIRTFEASLRRPLDLGVANGKCFTAIVGFGFDGVVSERVNAQRTGHISHFDYIGPLWRTFWTHRYERMRVQVDGTEVFDDRGLVFVGNISRYAIGLQILHYADFSDGLLDVCIYRCAGRIHLVKHAVLTVLKRHADCRDVVYRQGRHVVVSSAEKGVRTQMDGDLGPSLPADITVVPQAVTCLVPPDARPAGIRSRIVRSIR